MRLSKLTKPVGCKSVHLARDPQTFSSATCILFLVKKHRKTNLHVPCVPASDFLHRSSKAHD